MTNILSFGGDEHRRAQLVLPWYATGTLDEAERAEVESHLAACPACREDLAAERAMAQEIAALHFEAEAGLPGLKQRLRVPLHAPGRRRAADAIRRCLAWPGKLGWFAAGQALAAGLILMLVLPRPSPPAEYHTLSEPARYAPGNALVMFRPDTREAEIRDALVASRARIVDGPTASGAYVLHVAAEQRVTVLAELRARKSILLAQPLGDEAGQ